MSFRDPWPFMVNGREYDGQNLMRLLQELKSPFADRWDVKLLISEIEDKLSTEITDIPAISMGSNNYGFHFKLSNRPDVVARLARGDVNMPDYDGFTIDQQVPEVQFEAAVYDLLRSAPAVKASNLLFYRIPVEYPTPHFKLPKDLAGRRLLVFEQAEGAVLDWSVPTTDQKNYVLSQASEIRAALFNFTPPLEFSSKWLLNRLFEQKPKSLPNPVAPTRDFCMTLFTSKIHATIKNVGDMIGWEDDHNVVGPRAAAAKQSLLRVIPYILPQESSKNPLFYRLIIDHGDFGIHNMTITNNDYTITSVFDWETGSIVPAILSDPLMAVVVDLVTDEDANSSVIRVSDDSTVEDRLEYSEWARHYIHTLYVNAPDYQTVIREGKDARHLWFALRDWRGEDPEGFFGTLGDWAEARLGKLAGIRGSQ